MLDLHLLFPFCLRHHYALCHAFTNHIRPESHPVASTFESHFAHSALTRPLPASMTSRPPLMIRPLAIPLTPPSPEKAAEPIPFSNLAQPQASSLTTASTSSRPQPHKVRNIAVACQACQHRRRRVRDFHTPWSPARRLCPLTNLIFSAPASAQRASHVRTKLLSASTTTTRARAAPRH